MQESSTAGLGYGEAGTAIMFWACMKPLSILLAYLCLVPSAFAAPTPKVVSAIDGIFGAFKTHPLFGPGEDRRKAQEIDFYTALIRDPRFARDVGKSSWNSATRLIKTSWTAMW